ncbi:hypothetical protein HYH02_005807 [Chlamydomonas schloesseri]|uniref:Uncharacterized protein n=1 Tax=Chlamydomonas schloesseri TaxID=2026947 RepID=A0A835WKP6_9CHLO|nr:hypothetical protein HYH02_005807 [Chlamydomonas schloesseri]|eukprot:KAG2449058.1 hypothetical protein HYH02_005807 [Chlamydomonas schloesseri]
MAELAPPIQAAEPLTPAQKARLVAILEVVTQRVGENISTFRALNGMLWVACTLELPVPAALIRRQLDLALRPSPREVMAGTAEGRYFYAYVFSNCIKMGVQPASPAEAQAWAERLCSARAGAWTAKELVVGLGALAQLDTFSVTPEVEQAALAAVGDPKLACTQAEARALLELFGRLGVELSGDVRDQLLRLQQGRQKARPQQQANKKQQR